MRVLSASEGHGVKKATYHWSSGFYLKIEISEYLIQKDNYFLNNYTMSGRIGKVVASHAEGCKISRSNPGCDRASPIYTVREALRAYCPTGWGVRPVNWIYRL